MNDGAAPRVAPLPGFDAVPAGAWDALADAGGFSAFRSLGWHRGVWNHLRGDRRLRLFGAWRGDRLVGIAPMCEETGGRRTALRFIGALRGDYCELLFEPGDGAAGEALVDALVNAAGEDRALCFEKIRDDAPTAAILDARGGIFARRPAATCPVMQLSAAPGRVAEVTGRKKFRYLKRSLERQGRLETLHLVDAEAILSQLDVLFDQHVERWSVTPTPSQFLDVANRDFYREVVAALGPRSAFMYSEMRIDGCPLACHLGPMVDSRFLWYKPAFDIRWFRHSPGLMLMLECIQEAASRGCDAFDFAAGNEPYKDRFADDVHHTRDYVAFDRPLRAFPARVARLRQLGVRGVLGRLKARAAVAASAACVDVYLGEPGSNGQAPAPSPTFPAPTAVVLDDFLRDCPFDDVDRRQRYLASVFGRLRRGQLPRVITLDGRIVAQAWLHDEDEVPIDEVATAFNLGDGATCRVVRATWTHPDYRGRGLNTWLLQSIVAESPGLPVVIYFECANRASRRAVEKVFRPYCRYRRVRLGRYQRVTRRPLSASRGD